MNVKTGALPGLFMICAGAVLSAACSTTSPSALDQRQERLQALIEETQNGIRSYQSFSFAERRYTFESKANRSLAWIVDLVQRNPGMANEAFAAVRPFLFINAGDDDAPAKALVAIAEAGHQDLKYRLADTLLERLARTDMNHHHGFIGEFEALVDQSKDTALYLIEQKGTPTAVISYAGIRHSSLAQNALEFLRLRAGLPVREFDSDPVREMKKIRAELHMAPESAPGLN